MSRLIAILIVRLPPSIFLLFLAYQMFSNFHADASRYNTLTKTQTAHAEGTVAAILRNNPGRAGRTASQTVKMVFSTTGGEEVAFEAHVPGDKTSIGMKFPVQYDPHNPQSSEVEPDVEPSHIFAVIYVVAALLAVASLANLWNLLSVVRELFDEKN